MACAFSHRYMVMSRRRRRCTTCYNLLLHFAVCTFQIGVARLASSASSKSAITFGSAVDRHSQLVAHVVRGVHSHQQKVKHEMIFFYRQLDLSAHHFYRHRHMARYSIFRCFCGNPSPSLSLSPSLYLRLDRVSRR